MSLLYYQTQEQDIGSTLCALLCYSDTNLHNIQQVDWWIDVIYIKKKKSKNNNSGCSVCAIVCGIVFIFDSSCPYTLNTYSCWDLYSDRYILFQRDVWRKYDINFSCNNMLWYMYTKYTKYIRQLYYTNRYVLAYRSVDRILPVCTWIKTIITSRSWFLRA